MGKSRNLNRGRDVSEVPAVVISGRKPGLVLDRIYRIQQD
jgi:hypothetical protein